jgi:hypothetical protein
LLTTALVGRKGVFPSRPASFSKHGSTSQHIQHISHKILKTVIYVTSRGAPKEQLDDFENDYECSHWFYNGDDDNYENNSDPV